MQFRLNVLARPIEGGTLAKQKSPLKDPLKESAGGRQGCLWAAGPMGIRFWESMIFDLVSEKSKRFSEEGFFMRGEKLSLNKP